MLKELVKIANRLDSLGLSKEADILDSYIQKLAEDVELGGMSKDDPYQEFLRKQRFQDVAQRAQSEKYNQREMSLAEEISKDVLSKIPDYLRTSEATFKDMFMRSWSTKEPVRTGIPPQIWKDTGSDMAKKMWDKYGQSSTTDFGGTKPKPQGMHAEPAKTGWDRYVTQLRGGDKVKEAWLKYVDAGMPEVDKSFKSYVEWYNSRKRTDWGGQHASPDQVIKLLQKEITESEAGTEPTSSMMPKDVEFGGPERLKTFF